RCHRIGKTSLHPAAGIETASRLGHRGSAHADVRHDLPPSSGVLLRRVFRICAVCD
ncbi:unnamed protein product, partial [Symbiodinium sp. KB8]